MKFGKVGICALAALALTGCSGLKSPFGGGPIQVMYDPVTGKATIPVEIQVTQPQAPVSANPTISVKTLEK